MDMDTSDRVALPVRVHEFLLACAGRIDDDALTDARELLAVAELDRAVELLAGTLGAGRIPISVDERNLLRDLAGAVRSASGLIDRLVVDTTPQPIHRFTAGTGNDPKPEEGVADVVSRAIETLPDIRSVWCVWRTTPAGVTAGPVPQRVVLVQTGPDGFAPSTAYRVEQALRRAGVRAAVEVVQAGGNLGKYHRDALAAARRVSLRIGSVAVRPTDAAFNDPTLADSQFTDSPAPRPVTSTRRRNAAHEKRPDDSATGRWQQRIAAAEAAKTDPPVIAESPTATANPGVSNGASAEPVAAPPVGQPPMAAQAPDPLAPQPTDASSPARAPSMDQPAPPSSTTATVSGGPDLGATSNADAVLSHREHELLRQLHEELAKREQSDADPLPNGVAHQPDHAGQRSFPTADNDGAPSWQVGAEQTAVNGIPPYGARPS